MKAKNFTKMGIVVADEDIDKGIVEIVRETGWKVIEISPTIKNTGCSDSEIAKKYGRQGRVLLTGDKGAIDHSIGSENAFGAYVEVDSCKPDFEENFFEKIKDFFLKHKASELKGKVYRIPEEKDPFVRTVIKDD